MGLAMEAAFGGQAAGPDSVPQHQPALLRHHSISGLPPRGPSFHQARSTSAALDAAFAAAATAVGDDSGAPTLGRTHSASSAPAFFDAADGVSESVPETATAADGKAASTEDGGSVAGSDTGSIAAAPPQPPLPAWQSPARIAAAPGMVPPLPLSRLAQSNSMLQADAAAGELDLLQASAAAPQGLQPPLPQPALGSSRSLSSFGFALAPHQQNGPTLLPGTLVAGPAAPAASGANGCTPTAGGGSANAGPGPAAPPSSGGSSARRPSGLVQLDVQGLTFETFGLESPDTITPGLQYARQVAQMFVDGRRCVMWGCGGAQMGGVGGVRYSGWRGTLLARSSCAQTIKDAQCRLSA